MRIKPSTKIHAMLRVYPQLEEVLEEHDIDADESSEMSIRKACGALQLDIDEVLGDIKSSLRDSATEGWLDVEESDLDESDEEYSEDDDYYEDDTAPVGDTVAITEPVVEDEEWD